MPVIVTELDIRCTWDGTLTGLLIKNDSFEGITTKVIGIHGWQDNLNSLLPLAQKLIDRRPNYEMYLYDRAGHGFSSHYPKGIDYSEFYDQRDLRDVIQNLRWHEEKYIVIGHSYGATFGTIYAASYPEEVQCLIAIDALPREQVQPEQLWSSIGVGCDKSLNKRRTRSKIYRDNLTFEKAVDIIKSTRSGIANQAARLLTDRSIRSDENNRLYFTRDEVLKERPIYPYTKGMIESAVQSIKAPVFFIGSSSTQWPKPHATIELLKQHNPHFELVWIDGPHHIHMNEVDAVLDRIERYLQKHLSPSSISGLENSKL